MMSTISVDSFGEYQGQTVDQYMLTNTAGICLKVMTYGATITSLSVPSSTGQVDDIVCGFDTLAEYFGDEYKANSPYFGCAVGRYAARVKDGKFTVSGEDYSVATNDGPNHLHGGVVGFDKQVWTAKEITVENGVGVRFSLLSKDGDEGYPGNLTVTIDYILTDDNALKINYIANTTKDTPLSLTNHSYFNLSGFATDVLDHKVQLASGQYLKPDHTNVPVGEVVAVDEATDFREIKSVRQSFDTLENGFEHFYVFDDTSALLKDVAIIKEPTTGRQLKVKSTEPGTLFYTGFYTSDALQRNEEVKFGQFRGICLETSKFPNGPNIEGSPRSVLIAGDTYNETTEYHFSW